MNRKQLTNLFVAGVIIAGLGYFLYQRDNATWQKPSERTSQTLLGEFQINDIDRIVIKHDTNEVNLAKQDDVWKVKERWNYPAHFSEISEFVRKASELKTIQNPKVGASQLGRLELDRSAKGTNAPTLVEFKDKGGKNIKAFLLGKKYLRETAGGSPYGDGGGYPVGRYVMVVDGPSKDATPNVWVINDPLSNVEPKPEDRLSKDMFKVEKLKTISVTAPAPTNSWKLSRETEAGEWQLADKKEGEELDKNKTYGPGSALASPSFNDIAAVEAKPEDTGLDKPVVATLETFDNFVYHVKVGKKTGEDNYFLAMNVTADFPKERTPGKDEKPEDKTKLDKEFTEKAEKFQEKLKKEKELEKWTYLVSKWTIDPLLKERHELFVDKKADEKPGTTSDPKTDDKADPLADPLLDPDNKDDPDEK